MNLKEYLDLRRSQQADLLRPLCDEDRKIIATLTLQQVADEFQWPVELVLRAVDLLVSSYQIGREQLYAKGAVALGATGKTLG